MNNASEAAKKLADEFGLRAEDVKGTGKDGLVTKDDVQGVIDAAAQTNIMVKSKNERLQSMEQPSSLEDAAEKGVILPSQEELLDIIRSMQSEISDLRENQAGLIERESQARDLTDDLYFIAKPNGHRWEERRVVDGKTVAVEFVGTAFFGPFEDEETIEAYLAAKRQKREDSYIDWANITVMRGKDARELDSEEAGERESHFSSSAPVNVLDRRIFAQQHGGHVPGVGQVVGQAQ
ncbi:hypothetical protein CMI47_04395 [Candidatus Pacearchaeota archaeon]|nr:hypothetical protein [Candidatus Pacearchaeota archaeon]|tara:strand:- start:3352 stop:4059 length:708 start_codon:yes stop_codon:yes gene_type:complete